MVFAIHWHESAMGPRSWTPVPPPSPSHPSGSSQCTGPECPGEMRNLKIKCYQICPQSYLFPSKEEKTKSVSVGACQLVPPGISDLFFSLPGFRRTLFYPPSIYACWSQARRPLFSIFVLLSFQLCTRFQSLSLIDGSQCTHSASLFAWVINSFAFIPRTQNETGPHFFPDHTLSSSLLLSVSLPISATAHV